MQNHDWEDQITRVLNAPADCPRITILMCYLEAAKGLSTAELRDGLRGRRGSLERRFGDEAKLDIGVRLDEDPMESVAMGRQIETADAILQIVYPADILFEEVIDRLTGFGGDFEGLVDLQRSCLVLGRGYLLLDQAAETLYGFVGRRRPDISLEAMRQHWLCKHAPLATGIMNSVLRLGYIQVHVEPEISSTAAAAAGFSDTPYDMADSINVTDMDLFLDSLAKPEIQSPMYEDEKHFLDQTSWRGAFTRRI